MDQITKLVKNLISSNYNEGAIKGICNYINKKNMLLTNVEFGISCIKYFNTNIIRLYAKLINSYCIQDITNIISSPSLDEYSNNLIIIIAYLSNYNDIFFETLSTIRNELDANSKKEHYYNIYMQCGFIMFDDWDI